MGQEKRKKGKKKEKKKSKTKERVICVMNNRIYQTYISVILNQVSW